jgi:hypothetical protein
MPKHAIVGMSAPVTIQAAEGDAADGPKAFSSTFYTGGALSIAGWDMPVVVDLAGLKAGKVLVANLDHDSTKRVGNFELVNDGKHLVANGRATAATAARDEVVNSAANGYQWQASLEVSPGKVEELAKGKKAVVNGQEITGPAYITRTGTLKGFGFVSHGADDNTTATIAASATTHKKVKAMEPKFKAWIEAMGFDAETLNEDQIAGLQANYNGQNKKPGKVEANGNPFEARKIEAKRIAEIRACGDRLIVARESSYEEIEAIEKMVEHAIEAKMDARDFRLELNDAVQIPQGRSIHNRRDNNLTNDIIEAAICQAGKMPGHEDSFSDQVLQVAHSRFKGRIGLNQVFMLGAEANGYRGDYASKVTPEVQNAAFGMAGRNIHGSGMSTISIPTILSNVANKFLMVGWNAIDMTPLRIAKIKAVNDFKQITTVSLTGDLSFEKVGAGGEIKHGTLGDKAYNNQADTYAKMLAITRKDIINDDLGALTSVPQRLGRGSALKLNDIFWTEFLDNSSTSWFHADNNNVNTGVADMTIGGLSATETIFMNQVDYDSKPLGTQPSILVVPTALKSLARTLMTSDLVIDGTATGLQGNKNPFVGRFRVESSPYMSNSAYTGYSAAAWYMLPDPSDLPFIEIAALYGRVEPVVETADAAFNVLGVEMRGYSDVGVAKQEKKAGVRADGGSS